MNFLSPAQEKATRAALKHRYQAVAFDIDGTLTELSRWIIPASLCQTLNGLPHSVQLAFCTGRSIEHIKGKLEHIFAHCSDDELQRRRWHILAENGGAGYSWNPRKKTYDKFLDILWPDSVITREALTGLIKKKFGWNVNVVIKDHSLVVRFHDWLYLFPHLVHALSGRTAKKLHRLLEKEDLAKHIQVQDSGIGNLVIPQQSGKGKAVKHWAKHLKIPLRDVLVVGDQAGPGGNDEELLSGPYGTPFTVGHQTKTLYPLPVLDEQGRKLWGPRGTEWLLRKLFQ